MAPVETQEQFERWLKNQPQEMCVAIATRSALRVFPLVTHFDLQSATQETLALLTARCILTSGVMAALPSPEVKAAADAAAVAAAIAAPAAATARATAYVDTDAAARAAARSADAASRASRAAARAASVPTDAVDAARAAADTASSETFAARTATFADTELTLLNLITERLWGNLDEPDWQVTLIKPNILQSGLVWAFWLGWYQGFLVGEPLDWELQRRVALIENMIWESGPGAVAAEIAAIEAKFHLEQEIRRLKKQLPQVAAPPKVDRKHNNPPPLDDEVPLDGGAASSSEVISLIWTDLEALDVAIAKEDPDPDKIKLIARKLWLLAVRIASYCGNKIDSALETAAKEVGSAGTKWAIRSGALYFAATQEGTQSVAKLAWQYAERLLSGG